MASEGSTTQALTPTHDLNLTAAGEAALRALMKARHAQDEHPKGPEGHCHGVLLEASLLGLCAMIEREGLAPELGIVPADIKAWLDRRRND